MVNKSIKLFLKAVCAGCVSIIVLSLVVFLYYHTGIRIENQTGATDYHREANTVLSTMQEGMAWNITDQDGFNNKSVIKKPNILLMGSSHMEATQVKRSENTTSLLCDLLQGDEVYNIGTSGHTIYRCVDNFSSAVDYYNPSDYVIIETNKISLSIDELSAIISGNTEKETASSNTSIVGLMQKIPAVKAIYSQMSLWKNGASNSVEQDSLVVDEEYERKLYEFLDII